ncbi:MULTISPECIES: TIR domain-containing protein [unclassified Clostridium]|uniref:TIR domain-containing protein n=1 Tax=unclassified Clostridium TaxID=2614128 RepID=UPI001105CFCE|nr:MULTISPECIES: TIR domain-containing protein [unclassified Clostridium]
MNKGDLQTLIFEVEQFKIKATKYCDVEEYIYKATYVDWLKNYNIYIDRYNSITNNSIAHFKLTQTDLSSTQKTVRQPAVNSFLESINNFIAKIKNDIQQEESLNRKVRIPKHQMRRCFKSNIMGCPVNPELNTRKVFIGMPFDSQFNDSYNYGIIPALNSQYYEPYKADNQSSTIDLMCKVCREIQSCKFAIINISGSNPNVMFELGLAYGLGKNVILIKDKNTEVPSDIKGIEYIEYYHAKDLQDKLTRAVQNI